ncbi:MAG: hypothetical protein ACI9KS_000908 [Sulfitobacter sp.]
MPSLRDFLLDHRVVKHDAVFSRILAANWRGSAQRRPCHRRSLDIC